MSNEIKELRVSNDAQNDSEELQRRIANEGYLFFKRLIDPERMRELRREMMSALQSAGWLVADTDPGDGIADINMRFTEGDNEYSAGYAEVYRLESFHRSAHWLEYLEIVERMAGAPVMPHPQKVARVWFPKYTEHTTPKHQDFVHFQGSFDNITCWAPIGDCPIELGGLAVIPESHKVNRVLDHHFSLGAGALIVDETEHEEITPVWHSTDYEAGDALFFPMLTIHQALPNYTEDRLRLSLDNRYMIVGDNVAEHMLTPHSPSQLTWEDIYPDWRHDDLKYYWKAYDNPVVAQDMSYREKGLLEAIDLARAGNEDAIFALKRSAKNDPDSVAPEVLHVLDELGVAVER